MQFFKNLLVRVFSLSSSINTVWIIKQTLSRICMRLFLLMLFTIANLFKQLKCLVTDHWLNLLYLWDRILKCYKNDILLTWKNIHNIFMTETYRLKTILNDLNCFIFLKKKPVKSMRKNRMINHMPNAHSCYSWVIGFLKTFSHFLCFCLFMLSNFPTMNRDYFLNEK